MSVLIPHEEMTFHFVFIQISYCLEAIAVQSAYRDWDLKRDPRLLLGLEFWFLLPSLHQVHEGCFNYIHETQGFIWPDCPVFCRPFSMPFSGLRQCGAVCRTALVSESLGKLPEAGASEMIGALNLAKQLRTQSGINLGFWLCILSRFLLLPHVQSSPPNTTQNETILHWVVIKIQDILSFDSLTLLY